jgi:hypothetical protein
VTQPRPAATSLLRFAPVTTFADASSTPRTQARSGDLRGASRGLRLTAMVRGSGWGGSAESRESRVHGLLVPSGTGSGSDRCGLVRNHRRKRPPT